MIDFDTINYWWIGLQCFIVILEMFVRINVTSMSPKKRKLGYCLGMCAQIPWLFVFIIKGCWYLIPLTVIDGSIWARGFFNHKNKRELPRYLWQEKPRPEIQTGLQ